MKGLCRRSLRLCQGLLGAFTKLVDSGKDHTFVRALAGMGPRPPAIPSHTLRYPALWPGRDGAGD